MQIRCSTCTKTIAIANTGVLPPACPHCQRSVVPERIGAYVLERLIATGGMGEVYLARHHELGTEVAIKLLPALPLDTIDAVRARFAREARLTAKIEHRSVVRVLDSDAAGDRPYLVLELVHGKTLRQLLVAGPLDPVLAARIVADTADVLAAAHQQGVLHRDIKPDNVMLEPDGQVRVLDFGIARAMADDAPLTRTGEIVGTPEYMAPEQLLDGPEATDERTDVHALGVLLYELLQGRSPYRSANLFQTLKLVESLVPKPPTFSAPDATEGCDAEQLCQVVARALQKQPDDRFESANELAAAVRTAVPSARTGPAHPEPSSGRKWWRDALAGALLFAAAWTAIKVFDRSAAEPSSTGNGFHTNTLSAADQRATARDELQASLRAGHWCDALAKSELLIAAGDEQARSTARQAFVYSHCAWLRVAQLPAWLAANDLGQRRRLFGDLPEPGNKDHRELRDLLLGDDTAWLRLSKPRTTAPQAEAPTPDALHRLLATTTLPPDQRADAMAAYAQRLPIEQPEHWLARTIERHLRGDANGATQAAENAWLNGAGELAVLLDTALAMHTPDMARRNLLWRRLAKSDPLQCPASTLMMLHLKASGAGRGPLDPTVAQTFPLPHRKAARRSFVALANSAPTRHRLSYLRIAVALWAVPDFAHAPWQQLTAPERDLIEREAKRVR